MEPFELTVPEEDFDWSLEPKILRDIYKKTKFDAIFLNLIAKDVIKILSPQLVSEPHNLVYDDDLVYEHLIGPLEKFVCNLDSNATVEDVTRTLNYIESLNEPRKLCRRVLKTGDVTFSCNDCGLDGTCVVCIDCFHKSAHKNHNYRMSNSDGGGCCDCGDIEAWKQNYACSDHIDLNQRNLSLSDFEDKLLREKHIEDDKKGILQKIARLPKGIALRYFLICQTSLHYARKLLSWNNYDSLPPILDQVNILDDAELAPLVSKEDNFKNYFTVLFNDEVHTYDHVINTLVKLIKCSKMTASVIASTVSREGRSLVHRDNKRSCTQVKDLIARDTGVTPLKVEVIHSTVLAHHAFAIKLIEWVRKMSSLCDGFRLLTAYTLLGEYDIIDGKESKLNDEQTLLESIMLTNTKYWKIARVEWNDLFVKTMLTDYTIKEQFARLLTRLYPRLMDDFVQDDHDHSVSILTLSTQLYTVLSLTCMLIEEENALTKLTETLHKFCQVPERESYSNSYEHRYTVDMYSRKRSYYIIMDIKYLISIEPTKWTPKLRDNVFQAVKKFLEILSSMQGMDSFRRQLGQHLEYEPEWETGLTLQNRLTSLIGRFVNYCSLDEEVLIKTLKLAQEKILEYVPHGFKRITVGLFGHSANCINYDVSILQVSIHLPLTRFVAALIIELMKRRPNEQIPYDESLVILTNNNTNINKTMEHDRVSSEKAKNSMIDIMEPSLRTEVMIAQFRSGMWRRNGYSLVNQIIYFHGAYMRKEMFDRDILVLQETAAMCEANQFMIHLLNKFQLINWITYETTREPNSSSKSLSLHNDEDTLLQTMSMGEEFLQLLLTITGERHCVGIGVAIKESDVIKNEVIQLLCIGSSTRSDLSQKLMVGDNELECIKDIANLKRSNELSTGKYELKDEYYELFNPFFYHYSRRQQSNALDAQLKRKKNLKDPLLCCPPPKPVELTKQFKNLNELLRCDITLILISKILTRALGPAESATQGSPFKAPLCFTASDLQLDQTLHLIGIGLHEQERCPIEFQYLLPAHDKGIFKLLKDVYEKAKRNKDLILWLMKKTNDIIELLNSKFGDKLDSHTKSVLDLIQQELNPIISSCDTTIQDNKKKNSELASKRRERILAMMKANQEKFLSTSDAKELAIETEKKNPQPKTANAQTTITSPQASTSSSSYSGLIYTTRSGRKTKPPKSFPSLDTNTTSTLRTNTDTDSEEASPNESQPMECDIPVEIDNVEIESVNMDDSDQESNQVADISHLCILCRDEQKIGFDQPTMVLMAYIQRSTVLSKNRKDRRIPNYALTPTNQLKHQFVSSPSSRRSRSATSLGLMSTSQPSTASPAAPSAPSMTTTTTTTSTAVGTSADMYSFTSDNSWSFDATFMPSDLFFGPHISTCGHVMHYDCWKGFFAATAKRETNRSNRNNRHVSFDLEKNEILCPLCECISNATIPLLPYQNRFSFLKSSQDGKVKSIFSDRPTETVSNFSDNLSACLHALRGAVDMFKHIRHIKEVSTKILINNEDKYIRLLQPRSLNDVLEELEEVEALGLRDFIDTMRSNRILSSSCNRDVLTCIQAFAERVHVVGLDLDSSVSDTNHARIFMMTSWSISYTVQAAERLARFKGNSLFEDLESSKNLCLNALVRFACASMMTHQSDMLQSLLVRKLRYLLINEEHLSSSPCCLDIDAFETLVSLIILLQKLYSHIDDINQLEDSNKSLELALGISVPKSTAGKQPKGSQEKKTTGSRCNNGYGWTTTAFEHEYFRNIIHLMFLLDSVQVIISMHNEFKPETLARSASPSVSEANQSNENLDESRSSSIFDNEEHQVLYNYYKEMVLASGHPNNRMPKVDEDFCTTFKQRLLPFLRSCAIFFHHLSNVPPPDVLLKNSAFSEGKDFHVEHMDTLEEVNPEADSMATNNEFNAICQYLGLPEKFKHLFQNQEARHLARSWLRHSRVLLLIKSYQDNQSERSTKEPAQLLKRANSSASKVSNSSNRVIATSQLEQTSQGQNNELMPVRFIRQPHVVNRLIDLPYDYSELVDKVSDFSCPSIKNEDSKTPTMCLICGVILCSQSYCCQRDLNNLASNYQEVLQRQQQHQQQQQQQQQQSQQQSNQSANTSAGSAAEQLALRHLNANPTEGELNLMPSITYAMNFIQATTGNQTRHLHSSGAALAFGGLPGGGAGGSSNSSAIAQQLVGSCTYHAYECSGGVGVFLRIRNCQVLLLSGRSKGCYMPAPYIDDHGETDFGLLRGNPLHLNRQFYEKLQHMWLSHSIPESVSRTLEYSPYSSSINWHLH